jgi:Tol biopolymer transport system component
VDRAGSLRYATQVRKNFHAPKFSPDGKRIAVDFTGADGRDVWILSLDQGTLTRATFDRDGHDATWTPDGQYITYTSFKKGAFGIFRTRPGSGSDPDSLFTSASLGYTGQWLKDGSGLVTTATDLKPQSQSDIAFVGNRGRGPLVPMIANNFQTQYPALSPDGKWLAFVSNQSGQDEVYVRPFNGEGDQVQVTQNGGTEPLWSPDGRELFVRVLGARGADLVAVSVATTPTFRVVARRTLFSVSDMPGAVPHANYDISPDGRTFLMVRRSPATRIVVLQNLPAIVRDARGTDAQQR